MRQSDWQRRLCPLTQTGTTRIRRHVGDLQGPSRQLTARTACSVVERSVKLTKRDSDEVAERVPRRP